MKSTMEFSQLPCPLKRDSLHFIIKPLPSVASPLFSLKNSKPPPKDTHYFLLTCHSVHLPLSSGTGVREGVQGGGGGRGCEPPTKFPKKEDLKGSQSLERIA